MVQVTLAPFLMRTVGVLKAKFCMETVAFFGAATGATTGVVAGFVVAVGVIVLVTAFCVMAFCASAGVVSTEVASVTSLVTDGVGVVGVTTATFFEAQALNMTSDIMHNPTSEIFFMG